MGDLMGEIFDAIRAERAAQDAKWGDQSGNSQGRWLVIMMERLGELARVLLNSTLEDARPELIQVAAVAVAWLEALEPRKRVRIQPWGNDGYMPANPADCPYGGGICCVSSSGSSLCGSYGGPAGVEDFVICSG